MVIFAADLMDLDVLDSKVSLCLFESLNPELELKADG
jgi:hypothetical protein